MSSSHQQQDEEQPLQDQKPQQDQKAVGKQGQSAGEKEEKEESIRRVDLTNHPPPDQHLASHLRNIRQQEDKCLPLQQHMHEHDLPLAHSFIDK